MFDVEPGGIPGGRTTIKMRYYYAPAAGPTGTTYTLYDEVIFTRSRSDGLVAAVRGELVAIGS